MKTLKTQPIKQLIRAALSLTILWLLFSRLDIGMLRSSFTSIRPLWISLVFVLLVPGLLVRSYRWLLLFNNHSFSITFYSSLKLLMTGMCLNLVLPASLGDIAKSYFGYQWSGVKERMLSISLLDKVIALGSVCLLGLPFAIYHKQYMLGLLALFVIFSTLFFFIFPHLLRNGQHFQKIVHFVTRCLKNKLDMFLVVEETRTSSSKLAVAVLLSILGWLITYLQLYLIFQGLQVEISIFYVFAAAPFLTLVRLFPFSLQGLGTDELAICFIFRQAGLAYEDTMAAALIYRFFLLILPGLAGIIFMFGDKQIDPAPARSLDNSSQ